MEKRVKVKYIWLFFIIFVTYLSASSQTIQKVEVKNGNLWITFNKKYDKKAIRYFPLSNPARKVFDIPDTTLASRVKNTLSYNSKIRVSQYKKDIVRVVIETSKPYRCMTARPLDNIYAIPLPKSKIYNVSYHNTAFNDVKVIPNRYTKDLIVIDPGHGGHDSGAIGGGKMEKHLVLQIAKKVEFYLKKMGYRVYLTRRNDRFLKLSQRTRLADRKDAKVFVSIHANSVPRSKRYKAYGIETYFLQKTRDAKSQRIAARENAAVLKGAKSTLSKKVIIDSVLSGPKIVQSNKLAIDVQRHMVYYLKQHYSGIKDGGVRPAPFYVLVGASRPSILVEVGYISHPKERKRLFTSYYQNYIAKGIAKGIDSYLKNRRKELDF